MIVGATGIIVGQDRAGDGITLGRLVDPPPMAGGSRWDSTPAPRGDDYDERWRRLAASGADVHGEANLVEAFATEHDLARSVLDAGCGTGRVAIELAARGFDVVGVDLDPGMLEHARAKSPHLEWVAGDLGTIDLRRRFGAIVLAGNVMIFVAPGTEGDILMRLTAHLEPGGLLIAGFQLRGDRVDLASYDRFADDAGLALVARYSTWERDPFAPGGDYAVSVHGFTPLAPLVPSG